MKLSLNDPSSIGLFQHAISAGMSDQYKMIVTAMKSTFSKAKPREIEVMKSLIR